MPHERYHLSFGITVPAFGTITSVPWGLSIDVDEIEKNPDNRGNGPLYSLMGEQYGVPSIQGLLPEDKAERYEVLRKIREHIEWLICTSLNRENKYDWPVYVDPHDIAVYEKRYRETFTVNPAETEEIERNKDRETT